jgi:hypothetical protein
MGIKVRGQTKKGCWSWDKTWSLQQVETRIIKNFEEKRKECGVIKFNS